MNNKSIDKKWSIKQFNNLIKEIREYINKNKTKIEKEEYIQFNNIANELEDLIQPYKRFKKNESMFIKDLQEGFWVFIDGNEPANPVISDKLIGLDEENPELDLTEAGENIIFSNNFLDRKIQ